MLFQETNLAGAWVVELEPHGDERGSFSRTFCAREFGAHGIDTHFPQCNLSRNTRKGTLRGMHYEAAPTNESKLVRCVAGAIYDVIVDLRPGSPSYLCWAAFELDARTGRALFVPAGFAHGFLTLADETDVFYHMGDYFAPDRARGFRWNDPKFSIAWPEPPRVMSERDRTYPDFVPPGGP